MRAHNVENELAKRDYLIWLRNARGRCEETLDLAMASIHRFEAFNRYKSFKTFRREQAISFKEHLAGLTSATTGKPLAKGTLYATLKNVRAFFEWLAREPGYRKALVESDAAYFNMTENEKRIATASRQRPAPSLDQVRRIVETMPTKTVTQRRDRAVIALIMLTGARDAAVATLKLKHLDLANRTLFQDARDVKTKRAKTMTTVFFPVGEPFETVVREWAEELMGVRGFEPDDPLFPATHVQPNEDGLFNALGVDRRGWRDAAPIRAIFKRACAAAGLPYFNPHSLRQTLMRVAYDMKLHPVQLKAWSQNLGHDSVLMSLGSYGNLSLHEQRDVMESLGRKQELTPDLEAAVETVLGALRLLK
jgi:integrase